MKALDFAVVGNPIAHSLSPQIHQHFAKQAGIYLQYDRMLVKPEEFEVSVHAFFERGGAGLNVTAPFKRQAYQMSVVTTSLCDTAQAANTLWMSEGRLHGANTDGIGLVRDLKRHIQLAHQSVLILGAGGATRGLIAPLIDSGIASLTIANRTLENADKLCESFPTVRGILLDEIDSAYDIVIHATSGDLTSLPFMKKLISENGANPRPFFYDLSYQLNYPTPFVAWALQHQCNARDGLGMLIEQAAESFCLWHGVRPDTGGLFEELKQKTL